MADNIYSYEYIKSIIIFKKILSLLYINKKLEIIRYNKKLQKRLNLDIEYFKNISGKLQIINNWKIKEYNLYTYKLIFEGEYLNGKKMDME